MTLQTSISTGCDISYSFCQDDHISGNSFHRVNQGSSYKLDNGVQVECPLRVAPRATLCEVDGVCIKLGVIRRGNDFRNEKSHILAITGFYSHMMPQPSFDTASDVSSDESEAGSPVTLSSIAGPTDPSFDEPFPFPVDETGDHSVPETSDTSVTSAETPPEKSDHSPIVRKQSGKTLLSILKRPRHDPKEVDPFKFVHEDKRSRESYADETPPASGSTVLSLSRAEGSIEPPQTSTSSTRRRVRFSSIPTFQEPSLFEPDGTNEVKYDQGEQSTKEIPYNIEEDMLDWTPPSSDAETDGENESLDEKSREPPPQEKPAFKQRRKPAGTLSVMSSQLNSLERKLEQKGRLGEYNTTHELPHLIALCREVKGQIISAPKEDPQVPPTIIQLRRLYQDAYGGLDNIRKTGYKMNLDDEAFQALQLPDLEPK